MNGVGLWAVSYALCPVASTEMFDRISSLTCRGGGHPSQPLPYQPSHKIPPMSIPIAMTSQLCCVSVESWAQQLWVLAKDCVGQWLEPLTSPFIQPSAEPARGVSSSSLTAGHSFPVPQGTFKRWPSQSLPLIHFKHSPQTALKCLSVYSDMVWVKHKRTGSFKTFFI